MQCESFPPRDADIAIGSPHRMTPIGPIGFVSLIIFFIKLELMLVYVYPQVQHFTIQGNEYHIVSGFQALLF